MQVFCQIQIKANLCNKKISIEQIPDKPTRTGNDNDDVSEDSWEDESSLFNSTTGKSKVLTDHN